MEQEKNTIIQYQGQQITLFSDEKADYVNLTEMAKAWKTYRSIATWLKNKQTIGFLGVWEKKYNSNFDVHGFEYFMSEVKQKNFSLSVQNWVEKTNSIGVFSRKGAHAGTYAHKDIAIRFAGWLSPEFELYLIEEIQKLKKLERQKYSYELLDHEQILFLVRLKEVFKYVVHQELIEDAHKQVYAAKSGAKNPFSEFHKWRNRILDINANVINERIKQYCIENKISLTNKMLRKPKREKILMLDTYESVRIAVWDFLKIKGEVNALNLANLVGDMIRTEKGEVLRKNETDLFHEKQDLGEYDDFEEKIGKISAVKSARQIIEDRRQSELKRLEIIKNPSKFNKNLKTALNYNPKENKE